MYLFIEHRQYIFVYYVVGDIIQLQFVYICIIYTYA